MTIYETIKAAISVKQAAEHYGQQVNRNGMACCPFHNDRHPSMKLNEEMCIRDRKMIVVHILAQCFGHCPVALVGVHHSGEDILLTTYDLHGGFIGIGIKLFRKFIAAVVVEISGVHIKYQLAVFDGIRFQTSGGDHASLFHLLEHFHIIVRGSLVVNIQRRAFRYDVLIAVAVLFTLIVFLYLCHISRCFQVLISGYRCV